MTTKEKRKHYRVDSLNLLSYTCQDEEGNLVKHGMGRTLNVSESGILLKLLYGASNSNKQSVSNFPNLHDLSVSDTNATRLHCTPDCMLYRLDFSERPNKKATERVLNPHQLRR